MVNELINLDHEIKGTNIKIVEKPGMRKDRFSALEYNFKIAQDLGVKLKPKNNDTQALLNMLPIRQGRRFSMFN